MRNLVILSCLLIALTAAQQIDLPIIDATTATTVETNPSDQMPVPPQPPIESDLATGSATTEPTHGQQGHNCKGKRVHPTPNQAQSISINADGTTTAYPASMPVYDGNTYQGQTEPGFPGQEQRQFNGEDEQRHRKHGKKDDQYRQRDINNEEDEDDLDEREEEMMNVE